MHIVADPHPQITLLRPWLCRALARTHSTRFRSKSSPAHTLLAIGHAASRPPYEMSKGLAVWYLPLVKSGKGTGTEPPATDFSVSGEMLLLVTES